MKAAFVFIHPFSESPGSSIRLQKLVEGLSKNGVEVNIFNPYEKSHDLGPNIRITTVSGPGLPSWLSDPIYNLTRRIYYSRWYFQNPWFYIRGQEIASRVLARQIKSQLDFKDLQVIQAVQSLTIPAALYLRKFTHVPVAVDMHNLDHLELAGAGLLKEGSEAYNQVNRWTGDLLHKVDLVIAVSDFMKEYMISEYHLPEEKIIVVPPGGSPENPTAGDGAGTPRVVYAGMAAYRENLELYIRSIPLVTARRPDVKFYMSKKGEDFDRLMALAKHLGVEITPFWYESTRDFYEFMRTCSIAILPSSDDMARRVGTPLKLFDYLSLGLPVVCNDVGAWCGVVEKENVGVITESTPESFAAGILKLLDDRQFARECGLKGKELVRNRYNWDNSSRILVNGYQKLLSKPG